MSRATTSRTMRATNVYPRDSATSQRHHSSSSSAACSASPSSSVAHAMRFAFTRSTELEGEALHAALDELEWCRWLVAESRGYTFVARIVRDVVARDMVTQGERQRILAKKC